MVNRIADKIMNAVLPHAKAAAPCGYYYSYCFCRNGVRYSQRCRDCTGGGSGCSGSCTIATGSC